MNSKELTELWFRTWEKGNFQDIPVSDDFSHTSPFGKSEGKQTYLKQVEENRDKFLGYRFQILDEIYSEKHACVRYTAIQGEFRLDVSEWFYFKGGLISDIVSYYHIGEIREERQLESS